MDNGKPLRESRDIDVPLLARHFYYYAGWAQLMDTELSDYQPVGVVGQIIPWNFPLADAGLEDRPGHRNGKHGGAQTGLLHPPICPALRRGGRRSRPAAGRDQRDHRQQQSRGTDCDPPGCR